MNSVVMHVPRQHVHIRQTIQTLEASAECRRVHGRFLLSLAPDSQLVMVHMLVKIAVRGR